MLAVAALWSRFFLKKAPPQFEKTRLVLAVEGAEEAAVEVEIGDFNFVLPDGSDPPFSVFSSVPVKPFTYYEKSFPHRLPPNRNPHLYTVD